MKTFNKNFIAPCGINCGVCQHYLRAENKCPGCFSGRKVNGGPIKCGRRLCQKRKGDFCSDCDSFPCDSIKRLDARYREKYNVSPIENLNFIRKNGIEKFLEKEQNKWVSEKGILCMHDKKIYFNRFK